MAPTQSQGEAAGTGDQASRGGCGALRLLESGPVLGPTAG